MKKQIIRNLWLSFLSVFVVSSLVYWYSWWESVENAVNWDSLTHTVWNSLVDGVVKKTWSVAETVTWVKTFSSSPIVPSPTASWETASKGYVDTIAWTTNLKSTNGYTYLPNGLIIQRFWQTSNTTNFHNQQISFNFPIAFPNAVLQVTGQFNDPAASPASVSQVNILSNTLSSVNSIYSAQTGANINGKRRFFAIGY